MTAPYRSPRGLAVAALATLAGGAGGPALAQPGVTFTATSVVASTHPGAQGPMRVGVTVTARNAGGAPARVVPNECPTWIRIYRTASLSGPPAWSQAGAGVVCASRGAEFVLQPGASRTLSASADVAQVLRTLPPGRYHVAAELRLADRVLLLPAGEVALSTGLAGMRMTAESRVEGVAPSSLTTTVVLRNENPHPVRLEYGSSCAVRVVAHRRADRTGRPAFDSRARRPYPDNGSVYGCTLALLEHTVAPGGEARFTFTAPVYELLGDSLGDGRYHLTALVDVNSTETSIAAGDVVLVRRQAPLPPVREADGLVYRAESEVLAGPPRRLRVAVTVTNPTARRAASTVARDCVVGSPRTATRAAATRHRRRRRRGRARGTARCTGSSTSPRRASRGRSRRSSPSPTCPPPRIAGASTSRRSCTRGRAD